MKTRTGSDPRTDRGFFFWRDAHNLATKSLILYADSIAILAASFRLHVREILSKMSR